MKRVLLEVAVDSLGDAIAAAHCGADRLELCSQLDLGGLSPSLELLQRVRSAVAIPIVVMIRPRAGDFAYTEREVVWMIERIEAYHPLLPNGFVFGALQSNGAIDLGACAKLKECCGSVPAVFHRAWDTIPRSPGEIESLIALGFARLLTSGCAAAAHDGIAAISELSTRAAGRIEILPGAGITSANVAEIVRSTRCDQVHGTFKRDCREARAVLDQLAGAS